jgi:hypothetical protein
MGVCHRLEDTFILFFFFLYSAPLKKAKTEELNVVLRQESGTNGAPIMFRHNSQRKCYTVAMSAVHDTNTQDVDIRMYTHSCTRSCLLPSTPHMVPMPLSFWSCLLIGAVYDCFPPKLLVYVQTDICVHAFKAPWSVELIGLLDNPTEARTTDESPMGGFHG